MTLTVHGVLAAVYKGRDISQRTLLTHASDDGGETSLCRRVGARSLCDSNAVAPGPPTCARCAVLYARAKES